MRKSTYFAVFEPTGNGGYSVYFPDLPGCISCGNTIDEAQTMATEALGLHLYGLEKDNDKIPSPSKPPEVDSETAKGYFLEPITVYPDIFKNEMDNRAVKTNLTIPAWLKEIGEQRGVNFSRLLQTALLDYLDINQSNNRNHV